MVFLRVDSCLIVHNAIYLIVTAATIDLDDLKYFDRQKPDFETFLMPSDFASELGDDDWHDTDDWALYSSGKFEGDLNIDMDIIILPNDNTNSDSSDSSPLGSVLYNAVRNRQQLWPGSKIPYALSSQYSPYSRSVIAAAMEEYALHTCVRWVPRSVDDYDYIYIVPDRGCYSMVGKTGGKQTVSLGTGCIQKGIIMHELMHAVGFFHEQSRADRDYHITVLWENIQPGMQGQFEKYDHGMIDSLGADYDYESIMHYGPRAFSRNGQPTLVPKRPAIIGQRLRFSNLDTFKINKLYNCPLNVNEVAAVVATTPTDNKPNPANATSTSTGTCIDVRSDCDALVAHGWCNANPRWMKHYCAKSCNMCITDTRCVDQRPDCFILVQNGHCIISDAFMQAFCPKSCGYCNETEAGMNNSTTTVPTKPTSSTVETTKPDGSTQSSIENERKTTKKSIRNSANASTTKAMTKSCTDRKRFCIHWKNAGFCEGLFYSYMAENCQRSCKICEIDDNSNAESL